MTLLAADPKGYNRYIMSYLVAEVLELVPPAIHEFLIKSAILERFCAPLCDAVTGLTDAAGDARASLEWLERNNLFLLSVDEEHRWFRYHHLFRRLLLDQLEQQRGRAEVNALHERASAWFGQNGYAEEALQHALAAGATAAAVQIVARYRCELTNEEQWQRLDRWVRLFPPEVSDQEPELLLAEVWFMVNRQHLAGIPPLLDRVEAVLAQGTIDAATARRLQGEVEIRRATLYFYAGDHGRSLTNAAAALEKVPVGWWLLRAQARLFLSAGYQAQGDLERAYATLYAAGEPAQGLAAQMRLLVDACFIHWIAGDLSGVIQAATQILTHSDELGSQVETITWARYHLAVCHYARNELAEAERLLALNVRQRYQSHMQCYVNGAAALALTYEAQGHADKAREVVAQMVAYTLEIGGAVGYSAAKAFEAELALRQGRLAEAVNWVEQSDVPLTIPRPLFHRPPVTLVKILLAQNTPASRQQAGQVLAQFHDYSASIHYTSVVIEVLATEALLYHIEDRQAGGAGGPAAGARPGRSRRLHPRICRSRRAAGTSAGKARTRPGRLAVHSQDPGGLSADSGAGGSPPPGQCGAALAAYGARTGCVGAAEPALHRQRDCGKAGDYGGHGAQPCAAHCRKAGRARAADDCAGCQRSGSPRIITPPITRNW